MDRQYSKGSRKYFPSSVKCFYHEVKPFRATALNSVMKLFHSAKHNTHHCLFRKPVNMDNPNFLAHISLYSRPRKSLGALWGTFISSYSSILQHFKLSFSPFPPSSN